jgi:surface polysaccharide O-acyltransferase-like enzyme
MEDKLIFNKEEPNKNKPSKANVILGIIFISVGLLVLLAINELIDFELLAKYIVPVSFIIVGAILLTKSKKIKLIIILITIILAFGLMIGSKVYDNCEHHKKYADREMTIEEFDFQSDIPQSTDATASGDVPEIPE